MIKYNQFAISLCIGLNDDLFSYDELHTMIDFACTLVVVARLLYVFVYSLSFCTSCTISIINKYAYPIGHGDTID